MGGELAASPGLPPGGGGGTPQREPAGPRTGVPPQGVGGGGALGHPGGGRHRPPGGGLLAGPPVPGARFAYSGAVTCHWVDHPDQQHKIIGWGRIDNAPGAVLGDAGRGQAALPRLLRSESGGVPQLAPLRRGPFRRSRLRRTGRPRDLPAPGGYGSSLAGELGFNPERVLAFEERGHKLLGLWVRHPQFWDARPLPFGNIEEVPFQGTGGRGCRPPALM